MVSETFRDWKSSRGPRSWGREERGPVLSEERGSVLQDEKWSGGSDRMAAALCSQHALNTSYNGKSYISCVLP